MKKFMFFLIVILSAASYNAFADPAKGKTENKKTPGSYFLDPIVVTATKTKSELLDLPQPISVITDEDITQLQATDMAEILDQIPGVDFANADAHNPYLSEPGVRGLDRGRVVINVDGVNLTIDSNKGMELSPLDVDPYLLQQVEVQKGASSVLYGSGGLGGVIAIKTKTVHDLLEPRQKAGFFTRSQFSNLYDALKHTAAIYGASTTNKFDWMITGTLVDEYRDLDTTDYDGRKIIAKLGMNSDSRQRLQFMLSDSKREFTNKVVHLDEADEFQAQLHYRINRSKNMNINSSLSYVKTERKSSMVYSGIQDSEHERFQFDIQNTHYMGGNNITQELTYGLNNYRMEQKGTVDGEADNFVTPDGSRTENALFIQDRIDWKFLTIIGALRYNHYKMDAGSGDMTKQELLPNTGCTIRATKWAWFHLNYSHDFRAPSIHDMFTTASSAYPPWFEGAGYEILPNIDLKPESSKNKEIGLTLHSKNLDTKADWRFRVNYFDQDITDMITMSELGKNPENNYDQYSSVNIESVDRNGAELEASYQYKTMRLAAGLDYLKEKDNQTGVVKRNRNVKLNVSYCFPEQKIIVSWYGNAGDNYDEYPGYFVHNVRFSIQDIFSMKGLTLSLGIDNVLDSDYICNHFGVEGRQRFYRAAIAYKF